MADRLETYNGITIDYSRDSLIPEQGLALLTGKGFYKKEHEDSPQQTFARAATCYSFGDNAFAQRIYDYASRGLFTFASPVLSNAVDIEWPEFNDKQFFEAGDWLGENVEADGMPISCFEAGTPVMTKYGEKPIEEVKEGDLVLTHKGRFKSVMATRSSVSNDIYRLKVCGKSTAMNVTGNHLILTNKGWVRVDELKKGYHLIATNNKAEYDDREVIFSVENDDSLKYNTGTFKRNPVTPIVELTDELAWALGFWFAEGSTSDNGVVRVTNQSEGFISRWNSAISDSFGVTSLVDNPSGRNWLNGQVCNKNLQEFFDRTFGKGCYTKRLTEDMMHMSEVQFNSFFQGFYDGDGFKTTPFKAFEVANTELTSQISLLLTRFGQKHTLQLRKSTKREGGYNGYICFPTGDKVASVRTGIEMESGLVYYTIRSLEKLEGNESTVYDLQVDDDHSFSVAGVVVHNCFLNSISDTKESLVETRNETAWLSMMGGGVGVYAGNRSPDEKSTGVMSHLRGYDADTLSYRQTSSRRGSMAAYLDIDHPEIQAFVEMRNPVGGDQNKKCFNINNAVNLTDAFLHSVVKGEKYELVDPKHGNTGRFLDARKVWETIMEMRFETGEPYLLYKDTVNRNIPKWIKRPLYHVQQSNLCSEITLMTSNKRTAVCCLSSLNLAMWPEILKEPQLVADLVRMLDNVLEYFIRLAPHSLRRAVRSAVKERAIGLGTLGWHSLLQRKNIRFESGGMNSAAQLTNQIYKSIKEQAVEASLSLGTLRGEPPDCMGSGMRNSHLLAIAPNASSSSLVGPANDTTNSPSIEPYASNCYTAQGRAGAFLIKNFHLGRVLSKYGKDTDEVWSDIQKSNGSVQHLEFLTEHERLVFKTATEISPQWIIELAAIRQVHICQSQSVNIFMPKDTTKQEMSDIHMLAWKKGLKSLYYCRAEKPTDVVIGTGGDKPLNSVPVRTKIEYDECFSCSG